MQELILMKRIAVFASGSGTNLQALIEGIDNGEIKNGKIEIVYSNKADAFALERAKKHGILAFYLNHKDFTSREEFDKTLADKMNSLNIDLVCLAGYMRILTKTFLDIFKGKIMNIHPALLPAFGGVGMHGLHVHEAVIAHGAKMSGATVHFVDCGTDTGPIIVQECVDVDDNDTPETLQLKILPFEYSAYKQAVDLFCSGKLVVEGRKVRILK
jgi:phosphoribosylglycinamide formyltransferase-1